MQDGFREVCAPTLPGGLDGDRVVQEEPPARTARPRAADRVRASLSWPSGGSSQHSGPHV